MIVKLQGGPGGGMTVDLHVDDLPSTIHLPILPPVPIIPLGTIPHHFAVYRQVALGSHHYRFAGDTDASA